MEEDVRSPKPPPRPCPAAPGPRQDLEGIFTALVMDVGMKLARLPIVEQTGAQLHLPPGSGFPIGVGETLILVLYLVPRTSVLGAVLFTGLFGGTAAVHWLNHDPLFSHVLFGVYLALFACGGLWLRDSALRPAA